MVADASGIARTNRMILNLCKSTCGIYELLFESELLREAAPMGKRKEGKEENKLFPADQGGDYRSSDQNYDVSFLRLTNVIEAFVPFDSPAFQSVFLSDYFGSLCCCAQVIGQSSPRR